MCVRGLDVHTLKSLNEAQRVEERNSKKGSAGRDRVTGRKKERGKRE